MPAPPARRRRSRAGLLIGVGTAIVLAGAAFAADGGLRLQRTTVVEVIVMLLGASLCAAALLVPQARMRKFHGATTLVLVALLAAYTAVSVIWSLAPSDSWIEGGRTFTYVMTFAGTMALARLAPGRWYAVLHGIALACVLVSGWALMTKVFPEWLAETETYARLRAPFGYWNSVGLMAALGIPPLIWLGARRSGWAPANALAWPGIALLEIVLMLSYSRGSLLALAVGLLVWFAVVPLRLRGAIVFLGATAGAAPLIFWAFTLTGLTTDKLPLAVREDAGHELGALTLVMLVALLALGLVAGFLSSERPASAKAKQSAGRMLIAVLVIAPALAILALANGEGGIDGQVSKAWDQVTNPDAQTPGNTPDRLTATSSVRARYWQEAFDVHGLSPWVGTGAGAYATVRDRYRTGTLVVRHAHGYVPQTLADLGWAGLGLSLLALLAWGWAAVRVAGIRRRDRGLAWDAERVGMATLIAVAVVFGVHSAVDWTWFVPANAIAGLIAAAWVVARPPLRERLAAEALAPALPAAAPRPVAVGGLWGPPVVPEPVTPAAGDIAGPGAIDVAAADWRRRPPFPWAAATAAVLVLALALVAAWSVLQPVRSVRAGDVAIERLELGELDAAVSVAQIAHQRNPLSPEPLWELAYIEEQRGRLANAQRAYEQAVQIQPAAAETWRRLGRFQLSVLNQPAQAVQSFRAAYFHDPRNPASQSDFLEATRAAGQPAVTP
ncbi:MAG: O-antigen ligase family protein [Solirubrobacteraceae bacterium]